MGEVYNKALKFKRIHRGGVVWNLRSHCEVVEKHLNPGEEVIAAFAGQKNEKFYEIFTTCVVVLTNKRILIAQKRVLPGYRINSITPDLFNDFQVYRGWIFGRVDIDTVKEVVQLPNLDPRSLVEIETNLSEYLLKMKPDMVCEVKKSEN